MKNPINSIINSTEEKVMKTMQEGATKLPTNLFLWGAGIAVVTFITLKCCKKDKIASLAGQMISPLLTLGLRK